VVLLVGAVAATAVELTTGGGTSTVTVVPNSVAIIDPATNRVVGDVPVGERPTAVAVGAGGVWVANADDGTVARIDPKSYRVVKTIGVGADVTDIAIGFGSVWVADGNDGTITRIDPRLNAIEATLNLGRMDPMSLNPVFFVAIGPTRVWATRGGRVLRIDPTSNEVDERIPVGNPIGLATGADSVFVTTLDERVLRIDPGTAAVTATYQLPRSAVAPLVTGGSLWLIDNLGHGEILRLDTSSLAASGTAVVGGFPNNLATGEGSVWISTDDGSVVRIDRTTGDVTRTIRVGQRPTALAAGAGAIWIAVLQVPTSA
jgi:YVTN family beta-propeller protein